ncbi:MAG: ABC transporter substrate-binding protein [Stenomitos rutilans HA7619-LM2]|jgi:neutral amino acid transport system substrate-binding protein|nr:ABC transporter substrate-binding protein [Stenomitos rutilans HA7619-LM2]
MKPLTSVNQLKPAKAVSLALATLAIGFLAASCQEASAPPANTPSAGASSPSVSASGGGNGLKIGTLLPATGDLASVGQPMLAAVPLLVETVNKCGGVNGAPVNLLPNTDDQTDPTAGADGMTKLAEVDKVAGVIGSFGSSVSAAAIPIAIRNKVMLVSPGSTSPVFTERGKKGEFQGYWARTAPPDTYQARALARLAYERGIRRAATIVINNDYGRGFEKEFVQAFKKLGGTVTNEAKPARYDPKATTFETEVQAAFGGKPQGVAAVAYAETGALLLKTAYQQGLSKGVQILLTDGSKSDQFASQVGKTSDGKFILQGAVGTIPGADGKALDALTKLWQAKYNQAPAAYAPQAWDAAALVVLAAQAAKANTGDAIKSTIREVADGPGKDVSDVCEGLKLLSKGEKINYQGASGNVDIDDSGDVSGVYDVWEVEADGKLKTVSKVSPVIN